MDQQLKKNLQEDLLQDPFSKEVYKMIRNKSKKLDKILKQEEK